MSPVLTWWRDHSLITMIIAGGSLAGAIPKYLELLNRAVSWGKKSKIDGVQRYIPGNDDWNYVTNPRFGFTFRYPRAWIKKTSTNTDGHAFTHPAVPEIEIRGWGCHAVVWTTVEEWINATVSLNGFRVIYSSEASIETRVAIGSVEATRLVYDDGKMRIMQLFTQIDGLQFAVCGYAPRKHFADLEAVFLTACHSLILSTYSRA
jgi:hypothetical protein